MTRLTGISAHGWLGLTKPRQSPIKTSG